MTIEWTPALAVGHDEIDGQHQELFRRLASLLAAMHAGDRGEIGLLFDFLGAYVVEHFGAEEALMRETAYPGHNVHKAAHDRFVREYQDLRRLYDASGASSAVTIKTQSWVVDWLRTHIGKTDLALARHLRSET
jgi:hemerythrin-like metal-binding protein